MARLIPSRLLTAPEARAQVREDEANLHIEGLVCTLCAKRTATALRQVEGVGDAVCDLEAGTAAVTLDRPVDPATLEQAVRDAAIALPLRRLLAGAARAFRGT